MQTEQTEPRALATIAQEIAADWKNPYFGAKPYIGAMGRVSSLNDRYGVESARDVVVYFLANAATWRGPTARRIKAELKGMLRGK